MTDYLQKNVKFNQKGQQINKDGRKKTVYVIDNSVIQKEIKFNGIKKKTQQRPHLKKLHDLDKTKQHKFDSLRQQQQQEKYEEEQRILNMKPKLDPHSLTIAKKKIKEDQLNRSHNWLDQKNQKINNMKNLDSTLRQQQILKAQQRPPEPRKNKKVYAVSKVKLFIENSNNNCNNAKMINYEKGKFKRSQTPKIQRANWVPRDKSNPKNNNFKNKNSWQKEIRKEIRKQ